ncbi:MAG: hypothetical protein JNM56_13200 [Planctomycetia bacterium]|nr:hypothetical protein [Planctomycetia bacterium]
MVPIIPILAWTGGVAAGAQVLGGIVRGTGELVRGRPGSAMLEAADGLVAPFKTTCFEVSKLGKDLVDVVLKPWREEPLMEVEPVRPELKREPRRRRRPSPELESASLNGTPSPDAARA